MRREPQPPRPRSPGRRRGSARRSWEQRRHVAGENASGGILLSAMSLGAPTALTIGPNGAIFNFLRPIYDVSGDHFSYSHNHDKGASREVRSTSYDSIIGSSSRVVAVSTSGS